MSNETSEANPAPKNETKSSVDDFDIYVEDVFNRLALDTNMSPEAETEESTNRYNRTATEESEPDDPLVSEPLTISPDSNNVIIFQRREPRFIIIPSNSPNLNNVQVHIEEANHDTNPPATNTNTKKESYSTDILVKKSNDTKKEKVNIYLNLYKFIIIYLFYDLLL